MLVLVAPPPFSGFSIYMTIGDALRDLLPYEQFKNVKHPGGLLHLVKLQAVASNVTKSNTPPCVFFSRFLSCTNSTKSRKTLHLT